MKTRLLSVLALAGFAGLSNAQEANGLEISGYVDAYYQSKFGANKTDVAGRSFYTASESFALGNANVTLSKDFGKAGAVAQLGFGPRAEAANGANENIQSLYAYYNASDAVTLTLGKFGTFVGYEVIDAPANFHYSTSNLFQNGPFYHVGLKADIALEGGWSVMTGIFNSTDSDLDLDASSLHYGAQVGYSAENANVFLNAISGQQSGQNVTQLDLVADKTFDSGIYGALNAAYKFAETDADEFYGIAGYLQKSLSDSYAIGLRTEYFETAPSADASNELWGFTLSTPYTVDGLQFIPEFRVDWSPTTAQFYGTDGTAQKVQYVLGAAVVYSF